VTEPLLRCTDVELEFGGVKALAGVSISIAPGETVGLLGPNGSGKTSLVNVISGYYRPTGGHAYLEDRRIDGLSPQRVRRLGVSRVFQNVRLYGELSVLDNMELGVGVDLASGPGVAAATVTSIFTRRQTRLRREARDRSRELLEENGFGGMAAMPAGNLSYGQAKVLELLRAVAERPRLLLLDEPTSGVADVDADALKDRIVEWKERFGCSVLIVEHRIGWLVDLASRVYVLDGGVLIGQGDPAAVMQDPEVRRAYVGG
jgi:ABC-type branched-subunit amino acid transport system ATPase component